MKENKELEKTELTESISSASAEIAAADGISDEEELRRLRKIQLIKVGTIATLSAIIMVFLTLGWFSSNKLTGATNGSVKVGKQPFEIYTEANQAITVDRTILSEFGYSSGTAKDDGEITGSTSNIQWLLTDESHFNNRPSREQVDENGDPVLDENSDPVIIDADTGIGPGSNGALTFWIVPNYDLVDPTFKIDLKFNGLVEEKDTNEVVTGYKKLTDPSYTSSHPTYAVANTLFQGHMLFFEQKDNSTGKYSARINNMTFTKSFSETLEAGHKYPVTFQWIWPRTFGQMILEDTDRERLLGTAMFAAESTYSGTSPRIELATYINSHKTSFFYKVNDIDEISVVDMLSDSNKMKRYFSDFSNGYNNADQLIGNSADYALLEAEVTIQNQ